MTRLEAWWALALARAALWLLPWRAVAPTVDRLALPACATAPVSVLAGTILSAARAVPRATCLAQALALHAMLARRGRASALHIGIRRQPGFEAHAWLECDGAIVIGDHAGQPYDRLT